MANYATLKAAIEAVIYENYDNEITGQDLQNTLIAMVNSLGVGYQFVDIATPTTNPGTPDQNVFYIASTPGTYSNFGSIVLAENEVAILAYNGTWTKKTTGAASAAQVSQLAQEVTENADNIVNLQQEIDSIQPIIIEGDVTNAPDEEDITTDANDLLKFANRPTALGQMGYFILRKNKTFAEQVTNANTIYEVRYDFDLNGGSVTIPAGCVLKFVGGQLSGGTIAGNLTKISAKDVQIFDAVSFSGSFVGDLNACWVGAKENDALFDNGVILQGWLSSYADCFKNLVFPLGIYYFLSGATLISDKRNLLCDGCNSTFLVNIPTDDAYWLSLSNAGTGSSGEGFRLQNVSVQNIRKTSNYDLSKTRGIYFDRAQRFQLFNVRFYNFDVAITLKDTWYGGIEGQSLFWENRIGIQSVRGAYYELNTIEFSNIDFRGADRTTIEAVYPKEVGEADADYIMRTGACGFDAYTLLQAVTLRGCIFEGLDYGVRCNYSSFSSLASVRGGTFVVDGCYYEANRVEDIFIGPGNYKNDGSGTDVIRYRNSTTISNCRFARLRHLFFSGGLLKLYNNEAITLNVVDNRYIESSIDYDKNVTFENLAANCIVTRTGAALISQLYTGEGTLNGSFNNIKMLQAGRESYRVKSRLLNYANTGSTPGANEFECPPWSLDTTPTTKYALDIHPITHFYDYRNNYGRLFVASGDKVVAVKIDPAYNLRALNIAGEIPLYEFIRRWKAGITYTGRVANLFRNPIVADPVAGTVYEGNTLVGFGENLAKTSFTFPVGYFIFIDALVVMRFSYARKKFYCDILQCGRTYEELRRGVDEAYDQTWYLNMMAQEVNLQYVQKRVNSIFYDKTNNKLLIYNGFAWVDMTSPFQRYYYKSYGFKLSERATMADMVGQTFHNAATGITYTFSFGNGLGRLSRWLTSIGAVDSLDHPNGYEIDNTLTYATELSNGEMVRYNGVIYKWDGTQFVALEA